MNFVKSQNVFEVTYRAKDFYNYFKECYKLDYKEFVVDNILSQKYMFKWFVSDKEELLNDVLPIIPYINKKSTELEKEIELYRLEKKLFYASFFVLGKNENPLVKDKRICAPLLLFPASIKTIDGEKYLEIDRDSFVVNRSVITKLEKTDNSVSIDLFFKELSQRIIKGQNNFISLKSLLDKYFTNLDTEELLLFPTVWPIGKIRKHLSEVQYNENEYKIIPSAGTILVEKSESSLRVLSDLKEMGDKDVFNTGLKELLGNKEIVHPFSFSFYKSRLNTDQYNSLQNAHRFSNSAIVGPPGTGKTYTITSIISDAVIKNQSVLVVSKTKQAVEVLRAMLQDDFKLKDYLIHTTGSHYKTSLKSKIRKYLSGISSKTNIKLYEPEITKLFERLEKQEKEFEKVVERELEISDLDFSADLNLLDKLRKLFLKGLAFDGTKLWRLFDEVENTHAQLEKEISSYSKRKIQSNIKSNSKIYRRDIALFYDALDSTSFTEYKKILNGVNHRNILNVFPIWLANLSDLNSVLPLQAGLFDLVIIDEATQCDISSALPALYRAKRAVVVGDPNQLRHCSFVSREQQINLQRKFNLPQDKIFDYRNRSILDLFISKVQNQEQVTFLREHFRSTPSLIEFSNQHFYEGQLEILKSTPKHTTHKQIELFELKGERNEKGVNETEAKAVLLKIDELIEKYANENKAPSLGIISPYSAQVSYINRLLREKYDLKILRKFDLLCGSPYSLQGSEREIILISFCVSDNTHPSAFIYVDKPEVLNVTITRAKSYMFIFKSVSVSKLKKDSLLCQYFKFIKEFTHTGNENFELDRFQREVVAALNDEKYDEVRCGYPLAGSLLDILVTNKGKNYFIDLIGYPGRFKEAFPLERYNTLARTGVKSMPLHYSFWKKNKKEAIKRLCEFIV